MKRIFLIVLDSFGIGAMPDCQHFGDKNVNTLAACATSAELKIPNMIAAGLGNIEGVSCLPKATAPMGAYARLQEASMGKDTTIGHWEIAGVVSPEPLPTYPNGFPREVLEAFEAATGRGCLCNLPYSGTDVIRDYGKEQLETGKIPLSHALCREGTPAYHRRWYWHAEILHLYMCGHRPSAPPCPLYLHQMPEDGMPQGHAYTQHHPARRLSGRGCRTGGQGTLSEMQLIIGRL